MFIQQSSRMYMIKLFHSGNRGSNPRGDARKNNGLQQCRPFLFVPWPGCQPENGEPACQPPNLQRSSRIHGYRERSFFLTARIVRKAWGIPAVLARHLPLPAPPPCGEGDCSLPSGKEAGGEGGIANQALPYLRIWALLKVLSQKREQSTSSETGFPGCPPYLWITLWKTPFGSAKNALETGAYSPGPDFMQTITSNKTSSYKRPGFPLAYARGFGLSSGIMCISTS